VTARFDSFGASHMGLVRRRNEDAFRLAPELGAFVLADGMGGHPDGDLASRLAVETALSTIARTLPVGDTEDARLALVGGAIAAAHQAVAAANGDKASSAAMGSTLSVLLTFDDEFVLGNVGDSRAYSVASVYGDLRVQQLSTDHVTTSELIRRGAPPSLITGGTSRSLTQAIGIGRHIRPKLVAGRMVPGDCIVLCSDGATDYIAPEAFRRILAANAIDPMQLVNAVIEAALLGGGGDNCTCLCIRRQE
jgi:serine/threonine protein phosphatase PrpC